MGRLVRIVAVLVALLPMPSPGGAQQERTLADIRQELSVLYVELQRLKRELSTTGATGEAVVAGSLLDRVGAIESEVQRLTAKTEELEFRIERVVRDGTNRLGDLEFRLCELESGCDIAGLEPGSTLGGAAPAGGGTASGGADAQADGGDAGGPELAVSEQAEFDAALAAFEAGEDQLAADRFAAFEAAYPGGPLTLRAGLLRGRALERLGDMNAAARAFLDAFSAAPEGAHAPEALYRLGNALGQMGKTEEGCLALAEVGQRFPGSDAEGQAAEAMTRLGCR